MQLWQNADLNQQNFAWTVQGLAPIFEPMFGRP